MFEHPIKEEILHLIREIETSPLVNQRELSAKLGMSLGKTNYLLKELIKRGLISIRNFYSGDGKLKKTKYILTKRGLEERINLTHHFLKRKETEYNRIKEEWGQLIANNSNKLNNKF